MTVRRAAAGGLVVRGSGNERLAQFAFLKFPDSPVEPIQGLGADLGQ